ncbi:MAG: DUF1080 domain-containing protein [Planctomycetes bacterium]|nr:DUF1080 domain-containing protein [Planctomycetota bacterium]
MKSFLYLLMGALSALQFDSVSFAAEPKLLPREMLEEGWIQLFDGETLFGWKPTGNAKWEVQDGEIRTDGAKPGFLMSTTEWGDYEFSVEFRAAADTNSGVFLRSAAEPKDPARDCYELNIAPADNPFPTGSLVARQKAVRRPSPSPSPERGGGLEDDEWHTFRVVAWGGWITVELDGKRVADYTDKSPVRIGHIALQSNSGRVAFRNVRLQPIELMPQLTIGDLSNFSTERGEQSRFEINGDKELHVTNGPGQIETKLEYANFVLQLECKVNGKGLNSGIFFRALRDGRWAGYESQINNVFKDGDRTRPADFGTGAIYRRQPARRVVADDGEWFFKTIVADGPHMAVWVNGYQVSDWTDDRPPKENAREGLRLKPGVIAIQGHDPTTDFWFRDIQVAELPR